MDATSKWLFVMGTALALVVGFAVFAVIMSAQATNRPVIPVVVARQEIPERTLFTATNVSELLTVSQLPADTVPRAALSQPSLAIGKSTTASLAPGEVVLGSPDRLATAEGPQARPAAAIPRDKVALAINASEAVTVAGALQAGDRVDVIGTWIRPGGDAITQSLFQDVRVFGVGRWGGEGRAASGSTTTAATITLLLDYQDALTLEYLLQTGGRVSVALRRFDQAGEVATEPITPESLARRFSQPAAGAPR